jgi:hypothetical protein
MAWFDQFPHFDRDWRLTAIAESPRHAYLHAALSRMSGTPNTGGLRRNLRRARETTVVYGVKATFEVALCHRDPAFEGGPGKLREQINEHGQGLISIPPSLSRLREIEAFQPRIDMILLPSSPLMSNLLRLQLATPALIRRSALQTVRPWIF